jgi:hypothetical protein
MMALLLPPPLTTLILKLNDSPLNTLGPPRCSPPDEHELVDFEGEPLLIIAPRDESEEVVDAECVRR